MFAKKFNTFVIVYFDNIVIYIDYKINNYITVVWWVLNQWRKFLQYANLKQFGFYHKMIWFLSYIVSLQGICIENKKIEAVNQWYELQLLQNIQVFLKFATFISNLFRD